MIPDNIEAAHALGMEYAEKIEILEERLREARDLLFEAVDNYVVEKDPSLWTSRVRKWLEEDERPS